MLLFANATFHQLNYAAAVTSNAVSDYKGVFGKDTWLAFTFVKFLFLRNVLDDLATKNHFVPPNMSVKFLFLIYIYIYI